MTYSSNPYDVDPIDILSEQHQNEDDLLDGTNDLLDGFEFNTMMEVEFENSALTSTNNILFDAIQEDLEEAEDLWNLAGTSEELPPVEQQQQEQHQEQVQQQQQQQPMRRRSQRDRSTSPSQAASRKKNRLAPPTVVPSRQSFSDVSMCSYTTAPQQQESTTHNHNHMLPSTPNTINTPLSKFSTTQDYNSQLQNLAASIQRTEESRRVVAMMQRRMLTPEQKVALKSTTERLRHDNQQVQSSVMGRLMQQGRRQLGVYMGQVGQRTL